jgi:ABC-2 type transport system permease protein
MLSTLTGAATLTRTSLRRDRLMIAIWLLVLGSVCYASAAATETLYPSVADRVSAAMALNATPGVVALYGPIVDPHSLGELSMTKMTVLYAVFVALLFAVIVRRHTRFEEESGQAELLGGTALGRDAVLAAAWTESVIVAGVLGVLAALACVSGGLPLAGSVAFGASWAGVGLFAASLTAVACQFSASARTCAAISAAAIGGLFLVRAVGDTTKPWLSWLSPFGWSTKLHAWSDTRWWVLGLYAGGALLLIVVAQVLRVRRDLGAGMLTPRPGPEAASPHLAGPRTLALRLHTPMLVGWSVAVAILGSVLGSIVPSIGTMLDSTGAREMMVRIGGPGAMEDTLIAAELSIIAVVVTCFAVAVVAHSGKDEHEGRTEQVLATATAPRAVFWATAGVAVLGSTWLLTLSGVALGLGYGLAGGHLASGLTSSVPAALVQAPAVWVVTALAVAAYSFRSSWSAVGWGLIAGFLTLGQLGELMQLPQRVIELSPYVHSPRMPVEPFTGGALIVLCVLAAALLLLASEGYRHRDIG